VPETKEGQNATSTKSEKETTASGGGLRETIKNLESRYGVIRAAKFGIASAVGFLVVEIILAVGTLIVFHESHVPNNDYASPSVLGLNVIAFGIGITVAFFINERVTVRNQGSARIPGAKSTILRLLKFQLAYLLGNLITVGVQLALLARFSVTPAVGNIVGAIIAYPVSYFVSMRFVWSLRPVGSGEQGKSEDVPTAKEKTTPN
jgi:putative flippase GtrA